MSNNNNKNSNGGNGCLIIALIASFLALGLALVQVGGVMLDGEQRAVVGYPDIPAPAPEQLNFVPSAQTFAAPGPTAIVYQPVVVQAGSPAVVVPFVVQGCTVPEGWRVGVSPLPDCWESLSREEQNQIIRSH